MKNNRASLNTGEARKLLRNIGDPGFVMGTLDDFTEEGQTSVIQLNLGRLSDIEVYEQLHNNPDEFEVLQETDFGGRHDVRCVIRYVRKGPCKLEFSGELEPRSLKRSRVSKKREASSKIVGFGTTPKKATKKKATKKKVTKKKATKKKVTKKKATKKKSTKKLRPGKRKSPGKSRKK